MSARLASRTFSSLRIRNYRLYFTGQLVSVSGTWTQWVAQSWLIVKTLHGNGVELGVVAALQCGPMLVGGLWGGVLADRFAKRTLLYWTNALQALFSAALGVLALTGVVRIWEIYLFALLSGSAMIVDMPTRQAFVMEMVGSREVPNAVALNSVVLNGGRLIGPAVAAGLIKLFHDNTAPAFLVNAATFLVVIAAVARMDPATLLPAVKAQRAPGQVREGLRFIFATPVLRDTLLLVAILTTLGFNFIVVLPLIAKFTFHGGAGIYALLSSIMAVGSITGGLLTASRRRPSLKFLLNAALGFGGATLLAAWAPSIAGECLILIGVGVTSMAFIATANSTLQLNSPDAMRGRVMAAYSLLIVGGNTVGAPIIGWIAQATNARVGFVAGGGASLVAASLAWIWVRRLRVEPPRAAPITPEVVELAGETAVSGT